MSPPPTPPRDLPTPEKRGFCGISANSLSQSFPSSSSNSPHLNLPALLLMKLLLILFLSSSRVNIPQMANRIGGLWWRQKTAGEKRGPQEESGRQERAAEAPVGREKARSSLTRRGKNGVQRHRGGVHVGCTAVTGRGFESQPLLGVKHSSKHSIFS